MFSLAHHDLGFARLNVYTVCNHYEQHIVILNRYAGDAGSEDSMLES